MKQVLSIEEAAGESGLSAMTLRRAVKARRLPVVRIGRRVLIQRGNFDAFLRGEAAPVSRPLTDNELEAKLAAFAGPAHGEPSPAPISDAARIATALEAVVMELAGIRAILEKAR